MKKYGFGIFLMLFLPAVASAQYFIAGGIGYNVLSPTEHTVEVVPKSSYYSGNVVIPATVTHSGTTYDVVALGEEAFYGSNLTGITIPSSVTQIKYGCFFFATLPSSVYIPASVTDIGAVAFAANQLTAIDVDENNPSYRSIDGMLFSKDTATLVECPKAKSGSITLPPNTRRIASYAFGYCRNVTQVTLHEGITAIGNWAFVDNVMLDNVVIPATVTQLGAGAFTHCSALDHLTIASGNTHYYMDGMMIYSADGDSLLSVHKSADSLFLPDGLRFVSGFSGNGDIRYVHVPEGVTTIDNDAFNGSSLVSIDFPNRMDRIGDWAFYYCTSLTRVGMPDSLGAMGEGCFHSCNRLTSIDIPDALRIIPQGAFFMCNLLSHIAWGDAVEVIDTTAFGDCAFVELTLPPTLRAVRGMAFIGDYKGVLKRIVFTAPVDTIEMDAFYRQPLSKMRLQNLQPPVTTAEGCLYGVLHGGVDTLFIPCGSLDAYLSDAYWGQFAGKYVESCDGIRPPDLQCAVYPNPASETISVAVDGDQWMEASLFDLQGRVVVKERFRSTVTMDVRSLVRGTYLLRIVSPEGMSTKKILLQ